MNPKRISILNIEVIYILRNSRNISVAVNLCTTVRIQCLTHTSEMHGLNTFSNRILRSHSMAPPL